MEPLHESVREIQNALVSQLTARDGTSPMQTPTDGSERGSPHPVHMSQAKSVKPEEKVAEPSPLSSPLGSPHWRSGECTNGSSEAALPIRQAERSELKDMQQSLARRDTQNSLTSEKTFMGTMAAATSKRSSYIASLLEHSELRSHLSLDKKNTQTSLKKVLDAAEWWDQLEEPQRQGCLYRFVSSSPFATTSSLVILLNSVFVAITADWEMQHLGMEPPITFKVVERCFLAFFSLELVLRLVVHRCFFFLNEDMRFNIFDFVLVLVSTVDFMLEIFAASASDGNVAFMRVVRLLKLAKILRAFRVMKVFRALATMLESFRRCITSLFWSFVMLAFLLYVFSLVFMQGITTYLDATDEIQNFQVYMDFFGSIPKTVLTLYMSVTGGDDWIIFYKLLEPTGAFYTLTFLGYTFIFVFAVFNILTGIFVERAVEAAMPDREDQVIQQRREIIQQAEELRRLCSLLDLDQTGTLSLEEFKECMRNPTIVAYMASVGLQVHDVEVFFRVVSGRETATEIDLDVFVEGCMSMKGQATSLDVQKQLYETHVLMERFKKFERSCTEKIDSLVAACNCTPSHVEVPAVVNMPPSVTM